MCTALHVTAKEGHEDVAVVLLDHGANQTLLTKVITTIGADWKIANIIEENTFGWILSLFHWLVFQNQIWDWSLGAILTKQKISE